jgi:tight adherence protein C
MSATVLLLAGAGLVFCAAVLTLSVIGVATAERRSVARSIAAIRAIDAAPEPLRRELELPFADRVVAPLGQRLVGVGRAVTRSDAAAKLQHRLDIAGNPVHWDANRIIGLKALGLGAAGGLALVFLSLQGVALPKTLLVAAAFGVFGYLLPNLLLANAGQKREAAMLKALPDALDLLSISVEAGLAFDAAVGRVARETDGPLAQEFARLLQEMQIGVGRAEAMRAMADRSTIKDLKGFCLAMVQAESFGIPVARVLRIQATEMRTRRRQRAEENAQKMPVKILFPLIFFILPTVLLVVVGPVAISMMGVFGAGL